MNRQTAEESVMQRGRRPPALNWILFVLNWNRLKNADGRRGWSSDQQMRWKHNMQLCHFTTFISCFLQSTCISSLQDVFTHDLNIILPSYLISSCPLCVLCRSVRAECHSSDHHALCLGSGTAFVVPLWCNRSKNTIFKGIQFAFFTQVVKIVILKWWDRAETCQSCVTTPAASLHLQGCRLTAVSLEGVLSEWDISLFSGHFKIHFVDEVILLALSRCYEMSPLHLPNWKASWDTGKDLNIQRHGRQRNTGQAITLEGNFTGHRKWKKDSSHQNKTGITGEHKQQIQILGAWQQNLK